MANNKNGLEAEPVPAKTYSPYRSSLALRDAHCPVQDAILCLNLPELRLFKNNPFGIRDNAEMRGLVAFVRTRELAWFANMP